MDTPIDIYGLIVPTEGNRVGMIGPFPEHDRNSTALYPTLADWADAFNTSVREKRPMRAGDSLHYTGWLTDVRVPVADLIQAWSSEGRFPASPREVLTQVTFPAYVVSVTFKQMVDGISSLWGHNAGPFGTPDEATDWHRAFYAAGKAAGVIAADFQSGPYVFRITELPLSPEAYAMIAGRLGDPIPGAHPKACEVCFPPERQELPALPPEDQIDNLSVAMIVQGSLSNGQYRLVGPFVSEEKCRRWCQHFNRIEDGHGGLSHAMPVQTIAVACCADCWMEPGDVFGLTPDEAEEYAFSLIDPNGTAVIYASFEGKDDDGDFLIFGPMRLEDVDNFYETIAGGGTLRACDSKRELISPARIFQLVAGSD